MGKEKINETNEVLTSNNAESTGSGIKSPTVEQHALSDELSPRVMEHIESSASVLL